MNATRAGIRVGQWVVLVLGLAAVILSTLVAWSWLETRIPDWIFWQAGLVFLIALEFAYAGAVSIAVAGALILGFLLISRSSRKPYGTVVSRGLLLCVSLVCGFGAAEVASALWAYSFHRDSAVPVGGLRREAASGPRLQYAPPPEEIKLPESFPDPREDDEIDIVVMGESSAEGAPFNDWVSIAKIIAWQLNRSIPGKRIRLQILARSGEILELQHERLAGLARRPDLLVIYCGHNEFSSRLSPSREVDHYTDERLPSTWSLLVERMERTSPLCNLIRETVEKCRLSIPPSKGGRTLVDVPVYTMTEYTTLLVDFRRRLDTIISYAERIGALPVLISPSANDARFEPNRSFLPSGTSRAEREAFRRDFQAARRLESTAPSRALESYRSLLARQPGFAETHFRLAQLLERNGDWAAAYDRYVAARDLDGYPIRCLSAFQEIYRELAKRHDCIFIDAQSDFRRIGNHGLLDDELFQDGIHPSLRGQIALAQSVLTALRARRAFGWPEGIPAPAIDPAECAAHFGLVPSAWRSICAWGVMFCRIVAPLRYDRSLRQERRLAYAAAVDRIDAGELPEALGLPNVGVPRPVPLPSQPARREESPRHQPPVRRSQTLRH